MSERAPGNHVTGILQVLGMHYYLEKLSDGELKFYLQRGSMIHLVTAMSDRDTLDESSVDPLIVNYLTAWRKFRADAGGKMLEIELFLRSTLRGYCGTLDRVLGPSRIYPGKLLLDIKTTEAGITTRLQTSGYAMLYGKKVKRGAVALRANGTYSVELYDDDARDMAAWKACLTLAAWKRKHGV